MADQHNLKMMMMQQPVKQQLFNFVPVGNFNNQIRSIDKFKNN
jgi:hypothetical protein